MARAITLWLLLAAALTLTLGGCGALMGAATGLSRPVASGDVADCSGSTDACASEID